MDTTKRSWINNPVRYSGHKIIIYILALTIASCRVEAIKAVSLNYTRYASLEILIPRKSCDIYRYTRHTPTNVIRGGHEESDTALYAARATTQHVSAYLEHLRLAKS